MGEEDVQDEIENIQSGFVDLLNSTGDINDDKGKELQNGIDEVLQWLGNDVRTNNDGLHIDDFDGGSSYNNKYLNMSQVGEGLEDLALYDSSDSANDDDDELQSARKHIKGDCRRELEFETELLSLQHVDEWRKFDNNQEHVESDYADSDEMDSPGSSEDEGDKTKMKKKRVRGLRFKNPATIENIQLFLGQEFKDSNEFKQAIRNYAIHTGRDIQFTVNKRDRVAAKCKSIHCEWRVWASWVGQEKTFAIKTLKGEHNCGRTDKVKTISSKWIGDHYLKVFRTNPFWKIQEIQDSIWMDRGIKVSMYMCYMGRQYAQSLILGQYQEQFGLLHRYAAEVLRSNSKNTVKIKFEGSKFQRIYICYAALRKGFVEGCRPFISFDGCFLKGPFGGQLLTAVGRDGNNQMYPIAWAVVEVENGDSWNWFMELLASDLQTTTGAGFTIMSDQQKGLINAILAMFPVAEQRCCARHVYANFRSIFGGGQQYRQEFWRIAKSTTENQFEERVNILRAISPAAADDLLKRNPKKWCRAFYSSQSVCDSVDNNLCEVFNSYILPHRHKPIITMLDDIRESLMVRMQKKRDEIASKEMFLCPKIQLKIENNKLLARGWCAKWDGHFSFGVRFGSGQDKYVVHLLERSCSCGYWQVSGVPCHHAIAAIWQQGEHPEHYTSYWYTKGQYLKAYIYNIEPHNGPSEWPKSSSQAPEAPQLKKRAAKRPKMQRRKESGETSQKKIKTSRVGTVIKCRNCGENGHNFRGCKNPITQEGLQRKATKKKKEAFISNPPSQPVHSSINLNMDPLQTPSQQQQINRGMSPRGYGLYTYPNGYQRPAPMRSKLPTFKPSTQPIPTSNRSGFAVYSDFEGVQTTYAFTNQNVLQPSSSSQQKRTRAAPTFPDSRGRSVITSQALQKQIQARNQNQPRNQIQTQNISSSSFFGSTTQWF